MMVKDNCDTSLICNAVYFYCLFLIVVLLLVLTWFFLLLVGTRVVIGRSCRVSE